MKKMKIVIVAETIHPRIAPRSFRATELAKALSKMGHQVTLSASLGDYDYSSFEKKYKLSILNLGTSRFALRNSDGMINVSLFKKGCVFFLRKLFDFPDIFIAKRVKKFINSLDNFDILITVAAPYSVHWGATMIKLKDINFKLWISDCGDPFMGNPISKPPFYFKYLENYWANKTDYITVPIKQAIYGYHSSYRHKIKVIPQGFNFEEVLIKKYTKNQVPTFLYAGMIYPKLRDPSNFISYLSKLDIEFKFIIYTNKANYISPKTRVLGDKCEVRKPIDRIDLIELMSQVDFLINITNPDQVQAPSKLIDYSLSSRPILSISSDFTEIDKTNFSSFLMTDYKNETTIENLSQFDAKNVAQSFLQLCVKNKTT